MRGHFSNNEEDISWHMCPRYEKKVPNTLCKTCSFNKCGYGDVMCIFEKTLEENEKNYILNPNLLSL